MVQWKKLLCLQKSAKENEEETENVSRDEETRLPAGFDICFDPCYDPCYDTPCYDPCYTPSYDPCYNYGYGGGYAYTPYAYNQRAYTPYVNTPIVMCGGCGYSTANCICARVKVVPAPQVVTVVKPQQAKAIKTAPKKVGTNAKKPAEAQQAVKAKVSESNESQIPVQSGGTSIESGHPAQNAQSSAPQAANVYAPQQQNPNPGQAKGQRRRNCCGCC
ncbi:hypothetical protein Ddc_07016 [Ditylenchus destructor]|nr:hypothetical protein Ddc_07016 [Ditylenchus destructor]